MHFTPEHEHFHEAVESQGFDARAKIISLLGLAIAGVTTPRGQWHVLVFYAITLLALALALRASFAAMFRRMLIAAPFVLFVGVFLPFRAIDYTHGDAPLSLGPLTVSGLGLLVFFDVTAKAALSVGCVAALSSVEDMAGVSRGLQRMRVPALFVTLLNFTYRYLFVMRDEAQRLRRARDARAFGGRWLWHARVIGNMVGSLFLRSLERAERVYFAMASRGYEGGALVVTSRSLSVVEWLFIAGSVALVVSVRFLPQ